MTETSRFWDGTVLGDASAAPYDAATKFSEVLNSVSGGTVKTNKGGVFTELNSLTASAAGGNASPVTVTSGVAVVYGTWYRSDASIALVVATPAALTRIDRVVLRKSWAAQTVRMTVIQGVEGGAEPALVQIAGTTWDIPIASWTINVGGVIGVTDERQIIDAISLTSQSNFLGADVATVAQNNYYDGPSLSLAAGTWLLVGSVTCQDGVSGGANTSYFAAKLWDSGAATVYASGEASTAVAGAVQFPPVQVSLSALVTLTSTRTLKISACNPARAGGNIKAAVPDGPGPGNNASYLNAVKIA